MALSALDAPSLMASPAASIVLDTASPALSAALATCSPMVGSASEAEPDDGAGVGAGSGVGVGAGAGAGASVPAAPSMGALPRSEEHTSELQSLMRLSYAVFC